MPAFLAVVPAWMWRWIAIAGVGFALFGYGYMKGYLYEERQFAIYQAKVDTLANDAAERAAARKKSQDQTTREIRDGWQEDVDGIHAYYASHPVVVVRRAAGGGAVPSAANCPASSNGSAIEPGAPGEDRVSEEACALDAARVNRWRDFARKNNFPVD